MKKPFELEKVSVRLIKEPPILSTGRITNPGDAVRILSKEFSDYDREVLGVVNLRADNTPINMSICSMGALDQTVAHPRELLKSSFLSNACNILIFHNHPSGSVEPSKMDVVLTDRMQKVCELTGIPLLDHIIIGKKGEYYSFKEKGTLSVCDLQLTEDINKLHFVAEERKGKNMVISVSASKLANSENGIKGLATISFGDEFKVRKVAIMENRSGEHFVSMPNYRTKTVDEDGIPVYKDICNPITKEFRDSLYNAILESFHSGNEVVVSEKEGPLSFSVKAIAFEDNGQPTKGLARLYLEESFVINNMNILEGKDGNLFLSMPSYKTKSVDENGRAIYRDICYATTKEFRQAIQEAAIKMFKESDELKKDEGVIDTPFVDEPEELATPQKEAPAKKESIKKKLADGEVKKQSVKMDEKAKVNKEKQETERC